MITAAPTLTTERLRLRMPMLADFEYRVAFFATERSVYEDGPLDREKTWLLWGSDVAHWPLKGYGPFTVEDRATATYLGEVGIYHPEGFPEPEIGWFVVPEAEGRGIAAEAARAVMTWVRGALGWDHLVSYVDPANTRSIALGERIGGVRVKDRPGTGPTDVVIFHDLRHLS